jgi:hypothetical protein
VLPIGLASAHAIPQAERQTKPVALGDEPRLRLSEPVPLARRPSHDPRSGQRRRREIPLAGLLNALEARASIFKHAQCVNYFEASGYDAS